MSNFRFLAEEWPSIAQEGMDAERFAKGAPIASAVFARRALEKTVRWLYANDSDLRQPYDDQLSALMDTAEFRELVPPAILTDLHYIRKTGNAAAHDKKVVDTQSVATGETAAPLPEMVRAHLQCGGHAGGAFDEGVFAGEGEAQGGAERGGTAQACRSSTMHNAANWSRNRSSA